MFQPDWRNSTSVSAIQRVSMINTSCNSFCEYLSKSFHPTISYPQTNLRSTHWLSCSKLHLHTHNIDKRRIATIKTETENPASLAEVIDRCDRMSASAHFDWPLLPQFAEARLVADQHSRSRTNQPHEMPINYLFCAGSWKWNSQIR